MTRPEFQQYLIDKFTLEQLATAAVIYRTVRNRLRGVTDRNLSDEDYRAAIESELRIALGGV